MFKLVALSALVAVAVAKSGHLLGEVVTPLAHGHPLVQESVAVPVARAVYTAPGATSHTYREDIISKPAKIISTYEAAPIVQKAVPVEAAPFVQSLPVIAAPSPVIAKTVVIPGSSASTYREDTITKFHPTVEVGTALIKSVPVVQEAYAVEAAPIVAKTVAIPAATSSTYREDVISKPAVISTYAHSAPVLKSVAYTAPSVSYSAPAVAYSAPAVSYSAPAVAYSAPTLAYAAPSAALTYSADLSFPSLVAGHVAPLAYASSVPAIHAW